MELNETIEERFVLSADLGQSTDPTAVCVIQHTRRTPEGGKATDTFDVRHLQRLPLGLSYVDQVEEVARLLGRPPLAVDTPLVIDETGVGRAVGDLFDRVGLQPVKVSITAGDLQTDHGQRRWSVPKGLLISGLDARLHTGELRFAADLTEAGAMREELRDFRRQVSAVGRFLYAARISKHDDLVLAVSLALWHFVGRPVHKPFEWYVSNAAGGGSFINGAGPCSAS